MVKKSEGGKPAGKDKPAPKPKRAGGRPSGYRKEYARQAEKICLLGATDDELADFFGVHRATIYRWKLDHPEFCDSLKAGKDIADDRVERSLYQKATGYDYTEQQAIKIKVEQYREEVEVVEVQRHAPADTTAAIFWLKNRRKDDWRDKHHHEHGGKDGGPIEHEHKVAADADAFTRAVSGLVARSGAAEGS